MGANWRPKGVKVQEIEAVQELEEVQDLKGVQIVRSSKGSVVESWHTRPDLSGAPQFIL